MTNAGTGHVELELSWRDGKRYLWLLSGIIPLALFIAWGLVNLSGMGGFWFPDLFWFAGPILIYLVFPLLDRLLGDDLANPPDELIEWLEADRYYRAIVYMFIPAQYISLILAAWLVTRGGMSWIGYLGASLSIGVLSGLGINTAHELGHKKVEAERWLAKVALAPSCYGHFYIEHNRGHHVRVATPDDPASSKFGEGFWTFWWRSVSGGVRSSWKLEKTRFERLGKSHWSIKNDVLNAWSMSVVLFGVLIVAFGWKVIPFLLISAVVGFSQLESVNYVEHYGLLRKRGANGRYERCTPRHSWNSSNLASNLFLYHLQRHSDHHANPTRRYQALRDFEEAPRLPFGYAGLIGVAYFPPLWRKVMDKHVLAHYDGDITQANIYPPKRDKILARYASVKPAGQRRGLTEHSRTTPDPED